MLRSYILLAVRNIARHKVPYFINWTGMSIALGCSITAYLNYQYNQQFDSTQQNAANIYRISFQQDNQGKKIPFGVCPLPLGGLVKETLEPGDKLIQYISKDAQFRIGDEMFQEQFIYTDPEFTKVFNIDLIAGSLDLSDKSKVLISDKLSTTYFGDIHTVGKPITQIIAGAPKEFEVGGVYKEFPSNSSFRFNLLASYENYFADASAKALAENDWSRWATTFLYLQHPATVASIENQLAQYIQPQNDARKDLQVEKYYIESFVGMSARAVRDKNPGHWMNLPMPPAAVIAPFAMASLLLLVACFNFMNNTMALAANRLKEIGIRKVIGGRKKELVIQFLSETLVFCILSILFALVLAIYFTKGWNLMWAGIEIEVHYLENFSLIAILFVLTLVTTLLSGGYSAFYISSFKASEVLKGKALLKGTNWLSNSLLVFQFSVSLAAVIFAIAFYFNSRFQKSYDLGYSYQSVVQVPLENPDQYEQLKNELINNPEILSVGGSEHHIYTSSYKMGAKADNEKELQIDMLNVGDNYFETVNVRLIDGRNFHEDRTSDVNESIIVNEEFVRQFALNNGAIGSRILLNDSIPVYIIGVVKDVYLRALFQPISPVAFRYVPKSQVRYLVASTPPDQLAETNSKIKEAWQKVFPNSLYTGRLMEQKMTMVMEHFDSVVILYTFLGLVAIVMSISGLYALVSLNLQKRNKEFGIRKILGAHSGHITFQASKSFILIMSVSFIIGGLLGAVLVNGLMNTIWEYYEAVDIKVVTISIATLLLIALGTIGYQIRSVVVTNPIESLKYE